MAALLQDPNGEVRLAALRCLGRIGKGARGTRFRATMYSSPPLARSALVAGELRMMLTQTFANSAALL